MTESYDVAVIGGGPAGATCAGLLAERGHSVLVLEREKFPRYHIGESMTTGAMPALEALGLRDRLEEIGFRKYGGTLLWGSTDGTWDFRFIDAATYEYAYQVRRADFDAMLLGRARELGATVIEEAKVDAVARDGDRVTGLSYRMRGESEVHHVSARMVIDASGQAKFMGRDLDLVEWHEDLRNIAIWGYFEGHDLLDGTMAGDTITESCPSGWLWFIPLTDGTSSVGLVTPTDKLKASGADLQTLLEKELADSNEIGKLVRGARRVSGFRTARDWSYECSQLWGPGWSMVGDAAAFIDPLMSSGLAMALRASKGLSETVDYVLRHPELEEVALNRYQRDYRNFIGDLLEFIRYFYDRTQNKQDYWEKAKSIVGSNDDLPSRREFAVILSGMAGLHEVFMPPPEPVAEVQWHHFA